MPDKVFDDDGKLTFTPQVGTVDPCSFASPEQIVTRHIHFKMTVDCTKKLIHGIVRFDLDRIDQKCNVLLLDTENLDIFNVCDVKTQEVLKFHVDSERKPYGSCLIIEIPNSERISIEIHYQTDPESAALQWLDAELTSGKEHPFMFSQCQAIHARALFPCQDTPYVKFTFTAEVAVDKNLIALMSGLRDGETEDNANNQTIFRYKQPIVIPSYLVAIAVGRLQSRKIGPRSVVWAEKELVDKAAHEFAETEDFLKTAEDICGPYVWGVYDILVLPPSFPYGGMENPCISFVTPTLLAGDRSLANVVAHEITHSWTGNLVTNKDFQHFWLNEGFTVFIERKILGRLYGESFRHFHATEGYIDLKDTIATFNKENPITNLVLDLVGKDPDDTYSSVPYEKGHAFLFYLENLVGGPDVFEPFIKHYIDTFKFKSICSDDFQSLFINYFQDKCSKLDEINWKDWLYTPGMPVVEPKFDSTLRNTCEELAERWLCWCDPNNCPFSPHDIETFSTLQKQVFLSLLVEANALPQWKLEKMCEIYAFGESLNSELLYRWYRLCLKGQWLAQLDNVLTFVSSIGRMKFLKPLYRELNKWPEAREKAVANFNLIQSRMMSISQLVVRKELGLNSTNASGL